MKNSGHGIANRVPMDLSVIAVLSLLVIPLVLFTSGPLRVAVGLPLLLFSPGYALAAALFPRKGSLDGIERVGLALALSIIVVPLMSLALAYTPLGVTPRPILFSMSAFVLVMLTVALYRRTRLPPHERFVLELGYRRKLPQLLAVVQSSNRWGRLLAITLAITITAAIIASVFVAVAPKFSERFTEFYVLDPNGRTGSYPKRLVLGGQGKVAIVIVIVNHEGAEATYTVMTVMNGQTIASTEPIRLTDGREWKLQTDLSAERGQRQSVQFLLYKEGSNKVYRELHIWIESD